MKCENEDPDPREETVEMESIADFLQRTIAGRSTITTLSFNEDGTVRAKTYVGSQPPQETPSGADTDTNVAMGPLTDEKVSIIEASPLIFKLSLGIVGGTPEVHAHYSEQNEHARALMRLLIGTVAEMLRYMQVSSDYTAIRNIFVHTRGIVTDETVYFSRDAWEDVTKDMNTPTQESSSTPTNVTKSA